VFLLAAAAVGLLAVPSATLAASERQVVRSLTKQQGKLGSSASSMVVDLTTRKTVYAFHAEKTLAPASNEKLFVTATALLKFGVRGALTTAVAASPDATLDKKGRLDGDLYLIGGGDPTLGDAALADLAGQVRKAGIRRITGAIIGDESFFDDRRGGPDSGYGYDYDLGGALGGLVWSHGALRDGSPALAATARFGAKLKVAGIRYARAPRVGTLPRSSTGGGAKAQAPLLGSISSPPMADLVSAINIPSENFYAEMLAKALGAHFGKAGSTRSGLAVASATLKPFSIAPQLVDGSGLSRSNRTSALTLVTLLAGMQGSDVSDAYRASLPVAGLSGTLARRMRGTPAAGRCRAKTGTLNSVSALSGYCQTRGGRSVAFSLIENRVCTSCAKAIEDRMVATIARLD